MTPGTTIKVKCEFSRAGFSHERKFVIEAPSGGYYTGTAYIGYCFTVDDEKLPDEEPPPGKKMKGLLEARVIKEAGDKVTISVPDGGVCDISTNLILDRANVPVES